MKRYSGGVLALAPALAALLLAACASTGPAPVEDRSLAGTQRNTANHPAESRPAAAPGGVYRVERGDTLYSIAFRHGTDYRDLAAWNGITAPYTIFVGRELRLAPASSPSSHAVATGAPHSSKNTPSAVATRPAAPLSSAPAPFENVTEHSATASASPPPASVTPPPTAISPAQSSAATVNVPATTVKPASTASATPLPSPPAAPPPSAVSSASGEVAWRWPADGQVVVGYVGGDPTRQGVDIAGKAGDPVRAAADGAVVYSGNGLIGYGELIIVKHSPSFLSAYGHNRKRLVKEGDRVKAGQTIAEMGSSSASRDSLHFEIRKNGKPANPVDYLPRR
ncbi:MAG: peptidoglycan DD-metalloendopeptidase family protein [Dokdonella sp.]